jgi:hypothetical protein
MRLPMESGVWTTRSENCTDTDPGTGTGYVPTALPTVAPYTLTGSGFHMQTLIIYKLGFNQNYYTISLTLLIKIVMCSKVP